MHDDYIPIGSDRFKKIYHFTPTNDAVFNAVDLRWPKFDLDTSYSRYFLSWHTEQLDVHWLIKQANRVYPKPIMVAYDTSVINNCYPDNVQFVKWNTWGLQLSLAAAAVGLEDAPTIPKFKFSSLSHRSSQYKKFITAFLLKNVNTEDMILSWHGFNEDKDVAFPIGEYKYLDDLDFNLSKTQINFTDTYSHFDNIPMNNINWKLNPGHNALVALTNESFHYTDTMINDIDTEFPGPYLTEKTWRPLLGGRPFISVGQRGVLAELNRFGFSTDFGWNNDYDHDPGDFIRIRDIFNTILEVNNMSISEIYERSLPAVMHNLEHIRSGSLTEVCNNFNLQYKQVIEDFVN